MRLMRCAGVTSGIQGVDLMFVQGVKLPCLGVKILYSGVQKHVFGVENNISCTLHERTFSGRTTKYKVIFKKVYITKKN